MKIQRRTPSKSKQATILQGQDYCCFYCFRAFGSQTRVAGEEKTVRIHWDHQIPFAYTQSHRDAEFVAACQFCNLWKGSTVFETVEQAREFLRKKWAEGVKYTKECGDCGQPFGVTRKWQMYCTPKCQYRAWSRINRPNKNQRAMA